jgi:hypothetical protein
MPYTYTSPTAVLSSAKSYSTGFEDRYETMEWAREEVMKRLNIRVLSVQNGP